MKKLSIFFATFTFLFLTLQNAQAQSITVNPTRAAKREAKQQDRINDVKQKADQELTRRITSLTELISKVQAFKKLSDSQKNDFVTKINTEISNLKSLQTKISQDADLPTLQTDRKSIFNSYRVYMLFIPQIHLLAAADRMDIVADELAQLATKLQSRIDDAKNKGANIAALQTSLDEMKNKIADAQMQYKSVEDTIVSLAPDNGDSTKIQSNKQALETARSLIKKGAEDLKLAWTDAKTIRSGLK